MSVHRVTEPREVHAAAELFDAPPTTEWTRRFLAAPGRHLLLAYSDERPVGLITGIELLHPDKGAEMLLYELGVHAEYRPRGIARTLIKELAGLARLRDCYDMWVLIERDNAAAHATYMAAGGEYDGETLFVWNLDRTADPRSAR